MTIIVTPGNISLHVGQTLQMQLLALDSIGDTLSVDSVAWTTSDTAVLTISAIGLVTARAYGTATITATVDSISGSTGLRVLIPINSVTVTPNTVRLVPGGTVRMSAKLTGVDGSTLSDRDIVWGHQGSVSITSTGMVKGLQVGRDSITASSEGITSWNHVIATVTRPAFVRIESGEWSLHTCAIAADGYAFCWGGNEWGTLGSGTFGDSLRSGGLGSPATGTGGLAYPIGVMDLTNVMSIAAGAGMTCAVNGDGHPSCWGFNGESQTGVDGTAETNRPVSLRTSKIATQIVTGSEWSCFLATDSLPYCGGGNVVGTVIPQPAAGGRKYTAIAGGYNTLCGIGTDSLVYCGYPLQDHALLSPAMKFTAVSVGSGHACGLATDSTAYCWGANSTGQLGDTAAAGGNTLVPVSGGMKFQDIAAGDQATCGVVVPNNAVYCWGLRRYGILGADTVGISTTPVKVSGTLEFAAVTMGDLHACALSVAGKAYCWGDNGYGQLGDGTTTKRFAPTLVAGQQP